MTFRHSNTFLGVREKFSLDGGARYRSWCALSASVEGHKTMPGKSLNIGIFFALLWHFWWKVEKSAKRRTQRHFSTLTTTVIVVWKTTSRLCNTSDHRNIHLIWHNFRNQCLLLSLKSSLLPQKSTNEDKSSRWFFDNERENNQKLFGML